MAEIIRTDCCALTHFEASNSDSLGDLQGCIHSIRENNWDNDEPETTLFAVTTIREKTLEKKLKKIGFEYQFSFERRKCCGKGKLKFWLKRLTKEERFDNEKEDD